MAAKVIQIACTMSASCRILYALKDDGTIWELFDREKQWVKINHRWREVEKEAAQ